MSAALTPVASQAALMLSHWWSRPTARERELWVQSFEAAEQFAGSLGAGPGPVRDLADALSETDDETLLDEYERLFVGPGVPPCQPYESLWVGGRQRDRGSVMGPAAIAVAAIYTELGLSVQDDAHELPDHVMIEWEAAAYALDRAVGDAAQMLLREHLGQWMPPFCRSVSEAAREPFYTSLAALTMEWTAALAP
ncbi:MAG: molecular chaperone TorD family protein [Acidobacteriota bacterium]|nr:molecular chaperone TorD family protein [Acidobacteriota bacterium]